MSREILNIPLEFVDESPFIQIKPECIRNISLSRLSDMDTQIKDYGITLFINQIQTLQRYKILFPCRERLAIGEHVVFAYVILDSGIGLSTLINAIINRDQIKFRLNIVYITNYARMLESTDVICTLHKDGEINSIVRYQFSMVEKTSSEWIFKTLEVSDNMEYPGDSMHQKNNVIVLEEEIIPMNSKELIYLDSNARMGFPELFTRIYKAFDTKDEALFEECCNDYNQIIIRNAKLEKENAKLNFELIKLRYRDNEQNVFLENLYERLATQLEKNKI